MMLENKVALVTGGTSGTGRATALAKLNEVIALGAAGAKVAFSGRRDQEGEETPHPRCRRRQQTDHPSHCVMAW